MTALVPAYLGVPEPEHFPRLRLRQVVIFSPEQQGLFPWQRNLFLVESLRLHVPKLNQLASRVKRQVNIFLTPAVIDNGVNPGYTWGMGWTKHGEDFDNAQAHTEECNCEQALNLKRQLEAAQLAVKTAVEIHGYDMKALAELSSELDTKRRVLEATESLLIDAVSERNQLRQRVDELEAKLTEQIRMSEVRDMLRRLVSNMETDPNEP